MLKKTKRRYLALEIDTVDAVDFNEFADGIWSALVKLYGEQGASRAGLTIIHHSPSLAIIRVANAAIDMVRAALALTTKIGDKPVAIHVLAVSGTIKALRKKVG
ncbi:Rpp14/Pop5 family protein [Candidatus Bathyarchaeota archaeon]|nr:Rpp14/Pop5 family protein [Candidatus Bathyarchaeota archaeon]